MKAARDHDAITGKVATTATMAAIWSGLGATSLLQFGHVILFSFLVVRVLGNQRLRVAH